jgi:predicted DNA-binding transcriptional regulator AlpA
MATKVVKTAKHADLIVASETAELLGVTDKSLQRMAREGRGPTRKRIGSKAYYWRPDVEAWLADQFGAAQ